MITKSLKISQEVNVCGINTWITEYVELEEGDDKNACKREIIKGIQDFVKEENSNMPKPSWANKKKDEPSDVIKGNLEAINACETQLELDSLWILSKSNLILSEAWKAKQKQFNDAK
jgi:hypothetical protein